MNELNKHSFYIVNGDKDSEKKTLTKFYKNSEFEYKLEMDKAEIDSKRFLSVFDTTNDWVLAKVEYGPINHP